MFKAKGKKIGRSLKKCQIYHLNGRRTLNKLRRVVRHVKTHVGDRQAKRWLFENGAHE